MPRLKRTTGEKTSIEIVKMDVVKEKCIFTKETLKDYINRLIRDDIMKSDERLSIKYFKGENHF